MTNQDSDPIAVIKKTEEDSKKKIEQKLQDLNEDFKKHEDFLANKTVDFEKDLKEKGMSKLENVKKEAGETLKSKLATEESNKNKIISDAEGKKGIGIKSVISLFKEYIKAK